MAPRKQAAKQAAAETVTVAADGNATPPKKRKTSAAVTSEPKQIKTRVRQARTERPEPANSPKKSRAKSKTAAAAATAAPKSGAAKSDARSKSKKPISKRQEPAAESNDAIGEQVIEKKMRGGSKATMAKKAGTKSAAAKPKVKSPIAKKRKSKTAVENGVTITESTVEQEPAKRTTRRAKVAKESAELVTVQPAKVSRKRRNVKNAKEEAIAEAGDAPQIAQEAEEEIKDIVSNKKPRSRAKKLETSNAPKVVPKKKSKKQISEAEVAPISLKESEVEEQNKQNIIIQKNNSKAKDTKNVKKASPKSKRNKNVAGKVKLINDIQLNQTLTLEADIKENGEADTAQIAQLKQKKKNMGKTNVTSDEKIESKGRQKKGQIVQDAIDAVSADEVEGTMENNITEKVNLKSETLNDTDVSSNKDDSISFMKEENNETREANESTKSTEASATEFSDNKLERSASFIPFAKTEKC